MRASFVPAFVTALGLAAVMHVSAQAQAPLKLTSGDLKGTFQQSQIFNGFGCTGGNVSPQLSWSGAPAGTKSFAITMYDPDAPTGSGWWHWIVVNIPAATTKLEAGASGKIMPAGAQEMRTDFGKPGYGGPCPPPGAPHRYVFTIYALKVEKLDLDAQSTGAMAGFMINQNRLAKASFTATYGRSK
jgi:Raf kinase inhibitor-like YbhB/YbcL family protein